MRMTDRQSISQTDRQRDGPTDGWTSKHRRTQITRYTNAQTPRQPQEPTNSFIDYHGYHNLNDAKNIAWDILIHVDKYPKSMVW